MVLSLGCQICPALLRRVGQKIRPTDRNAERVTLSARALVRSDLEGFGFSHNLGWASRVMICVSLVALVRACGSAVIIPTFLEKKLHDNGAEKPKAYRPRKKNEQGQEEEEKGGRRGQKKIRKCFGEAIGFYSCFLSLDTGSNLRPTIGLKGRIPGLRSVAHEQAHFHG